jgi:hypothetical protein
MTQVSTGKWKPQSFTQKSSERICVDILCGQIEDGMLEGGSAA